jgi:hypothetical protein
VAARSSAPKRRAPANGNTDGDIVSAAPADDENGASFTAQFAAQRQERELYAACERGAAQAVSSALAKTSRTALLPSIVRAVEDVLRPCTNELSSALARLGDGGDAVGAREAVRADALQPLLDAVNALRQSTDARAGAGNDQLATRIAGAVVSALPAAIAAAVTPVQQQLTELQRSQAAAQLALATSQRELADAKLAAANAEMNRQRDNETNALKVQLARIETELAVMKQMGCTELLRVRNGLPPQPAPRDTAATTTVHSAPTAASSSSL